LTGHRLYTQVLQRMPDELGLAFLQPGRFLMPSPGPQPPWMQFFPLPGQSPLAKLMQARFSAYVNAVRSDLMSPMFANLDSLVVLADLPSEFEPMHMPEAGRSPPQCDTAPARESSRDAAIGAMAATPSARSARPESTGGIDIARAAQFAG
jgi:hypothetical protein